jgi:Ca2+/Na+ antiporter
MPIQSIDPHVLTATMLMLSILGLYIAARVSMQAAIPTASASPGRRALCQWLPIAATALAAIFLKRPGIALAVVVGTSLAYLSLVFGMTTFVAPMNTDTPRPRIWEFVLVPIMLILLAGMNGVLTGWHAVMLLGLGGVLLGVWQNDLRREGSREIAGKPAADPMSFSRSHWLQIAFAILLAGVAGAAAIHATIAASQQARLSSDILGTLSVLCPMLTLPSLRSSVNVAERGDTNGAVSALVGTVLLNFCLLLPAIVLLWYPLIGLTLNPFSTTPRLPAGDYYTPAMGLEYSGHLWQLETVALVTIGFALIPISLRKMNLTRASSGLLILLYAAYLALIAWSERRT